MRELDRTKKYNLVLLSEEQLKELFLELKKLKGWKNVTFDFWSSEKNLIECLLVYCKKNDTWSMQIAEDKKGSDNALGLFYTLENIQVDCRELSEEQINNMFDIALVNGFEKREDSACYVDRQYVFFRQFRGSFGVLMELCSHHTITYDKFMELFGKEEKPMKGTPLESHSEYQHKGKKETTNKTKYELDFDFIEAMAKRIESETKYPPYNWQLPINTKDLADALFRHAIEVKKGNFDDDGELGHLMAIANNAMFLYYQKKHHSNELGE